MTPRGVRSKIRGWATIEKHTGVGRTRRARHTQNTVNKSMGEFFLFLKPIRNHFDRKKYSPIYPTNHRAFVNKNSSVDVLDLDLISR